MADIRAVRPDDLGALYAVALATGDNGADASHLYADGRLVGHIYAAPYAVLEAGSALVAEDTEGVAGYIVGAADTAAFTAKLEAEWWPALRRDYPEPPGPPDAGWSADQVRAFQLHHPYFAPADVIAAYPAHLHINLLPRLQGQGVGQRLMDGWLSLMRDGGAAGVHLGVGAANARGVRFYQRYGFREFDRPIARSARTRWFVIDL